MLSAALRRAGIVLRFLFPDQKTRRYVRKMRQSGHFDRTFYFASNPRLRRLFQLAPERHYALFGEPTGLCPNAAFSPRAYLYNNPDIGKVPALLHFIETGQAHGRTVLNTGQVGPLILPDITGPKHPAPHAIVLHLFYHDLWDEFAEHLATQQFDFDLFVTATGTQDQVAPLRAKITAAFPHAHVWAMPNHGRDIFPFLHLVNAGLFAPYQAVCKLHGKRSPHLVNGAAWRQALVAGVMGDPAMTRDRLAAFVARDTMGLWVANKHIYAGDEWWGINKARAQDILQRVGWEMGSDPLQFPAGSVYWVKPAVIQTLAALDLGAQDFEPEQALVDGTTAHAIERLMGYLTQQTGLQMCTSRDLETLQVWS